MVQRCSDYEYIREKLYPYEDLIGKGFDLEEWLEDDENICLREGDDLGVFQYEYPGVFTGHYFFESRGRTALTHAQSILKELFVNYGARTVRGLTPTGHVAAKWMNRQLGFKPYGEMEMEEGDYELYCLTLDEFFHKLNDKTKEP